MDRADSAPGLVGSTLDGRYRLLRKLSEGETAEVYAAEHVRSKYPFAIKLLRREALSNLEAVTRFRQEAEILASIDHRNIVAVEDVGQVTGGRIYLCMELLRGAGLPELITLPMPVDRLLDILIQAGHGLAAAHAQGIVHCDVKPENIFVTAFPDGEDVAKLLGFGLARRFGNEVKNQGTRPGTVFGTPPYMAPEQALGNPVDPRADIYAVGVILYECFSGTLPFHSDSAVALLTQHITTEPEPISLRAARIGSQLPPGLAETIALCLQKDPARRFHTMDDLVRALVKIRRGNAAVARAPSTRSAPDRPAATPRRPSTSTTPPPSAIHELGRATADLVILTVLPEEYAAVLACLHAPTLVPGSATRPNTYAWQLGLIEASRYGGAFKVVVGKGTPTTTFGALAASQAIQLFEPRYIAFVGVAGGFDRDGQRHGDVAVSSVVTAYEYGKLDTGGFAPRGDFTYRCNEGLVRATEAVTATGARWWEQDENPSGPPRVRTGMIASGDKVIDDPDEAFFAAVRAAWPKLLAVEMEGAGVAAAVHEAQDQRAVGFVLVRGISDMPHRKAPGSAASTAERDGWKVIASRNAARFLAHLVATAWPVPPRPGADDDARTAGTSPPGMEPAPPPAPDVPVPVYPDAEVQELSRRLENAQHRRQKLRDVGSAADGIEREILELRRRLREGGQLRAGDDLADGRYRLVQAVGRGGFATVWEAYDRVAQHRVAVKVLHPNLAGDRVRRERFFRGAQAMMRLAHPAVVRVLEPQGEDGGFHYFVMEFVAAGNLRDAVLQRGLPDERVLHTILRIGDAIAQAHARGMIHRDIKPANILLDEEGQAKLTDFDLVGAQDTTGGTRTGALGTVVYAAPECLDRPQEATARADVYSLGMTAIFCLAGRDLSLATFRNPDPTISRLGCSPQVQDVLRRAVAWEPQDRFADARAMVDALLGAIDPPTTEVSRDEPIEIDLSDISSAEPPLAGDVFAGGRPPWADVASHHPYGPWAGFEVNGVQQRMRWIPAGTFLMGSPETELGRYQDEGPQHQVTLTRGYWLGETPVTQGLWVAVMGKNPSHFQDDTRDDLERPVEQVSWDDCQVFLRQLNARIARLAARLPTEAEWECACRGGTNTATWVGDLSAEKYAPELEAIAWYSRQSGGRTRRVGRRAPNPYGLHDMLGNVFEWCQDSSGNVSGYTTPPYTPARAVDPVSTERGPYRVVRGGSWLHDARAMRAAYRNANERAHRSKVIGFRLAIDQASKSR